MKLGDHSNVQYVLNETGIAVNKTIIIPRDCYYFSNIRSQSVAGTPFIRLSAKFSEGNKVIFEGYGNQLSRYTYLWTPPFYIKAGTELTLQYNCKDEDNSITSDSLAQAYIIY